MKHLSKILILVLLLSCSSKPKKSAFRPFIDKFRLDTLHDWRLCWAVLEPISKVNSDQEEIDLLKKVSPGQKALYNFWYLDAEVTNGGFIQFYWNDYASYVPSIKTGLTLIGDTTILNLLDRAERAYLSNKEKFTAQRAKDDWEPLYENLKEFATLDSLYFENQHGCMLLFEKHIRQNPEQYFTTD